MSITIFKPSDQTWPTWNSPEVLRKPHFLQPGLVERLRQGAWHGYTVSWVVGEYMIVCHLKWDATLHLENSLYVFFSHQNLNNVQNVCWWLVRGLILANIQRIFRFCRHFQIWRISWAFGWHGLLKEFPNTSRHRPQGQAIRNNWICVWCPIDASNSICVNKDSFHFRASMFFCQSLTSFKTTIADADIWLIWQNAWLLSLDVLFSRVAGLENFYFP